jgi:hypothetical protein
VWLFQGWWRLPLAVGLQPTKTRRGWLIPMFLARLFLEEVLKSTPRMDSTGKDLSTVSKRIVLENEKADRQLNLVARVEVQPGEILEFYEPTGGYILLSGAGSPESGTVRYTEETVTDFTAEGLARVWREASGSVPMPAELGAALERLTARLERTKLQRADEQVVLKGGDPAPMASKPQQAADIRHISDGVATIQQAQSSGFCSTGYYTTPVSGYTHSLARGSDVSGMELSRCSFTNNFNFRVCWDDVMGNGGWASHPDARELLTNVCPRQGNVTMNISADEGWVTQGSFSVFQNNYRWMRAHDPGCDQFPWTNDCPYIWVGIGDAAGDRFNFRFLAQN